MINSDNRPRPFLKAFHCPVCAIHAAQEWRQVEVSGSEPIDIAPEIERAELHAKNGFDDLDSDDRKSAAALLQARDAMLEGKIVAVGTSYGISRLTSAVALSTQLGKVYSSKCAHCQAFTLWFDNKILAPEIARGHIQAHSSLPLELQQDFAEAAAIANRSPRGACALARLIVEKLCVHLGAKGKTLDDKIGHLVSEGLPKRAQQALDYVRVIGNDQVHPGKIVSSDDTEIAETILGLINIIAEKIIAEPMNIDMLFSSLPAVKREGIQIRDSRSKKD